MNARMPESAADHRLILRRAERHDGAALHDLVAACPPLDLNSRYAYLLLCEHHAPTCVVAHEGKRMVGAVTAYVPPQQADTLFAWQVAVAADVRGRKLASRMLEHLLQHCVLPRGLRWIETTISPSNAASHQLFTRFALRHGVGCTTTTLFSAQDFGASGHEEECLYKIGPWKGGFSMHDIFHPFIPV
ncbi:MAG: diaminobutyrate acetyltransferase [Burkholderiales bacterium]|nr:diaminobutyrate acetyltransferase [Burkholderiales bacterium]